MDEYHRYGEVKARLTIELAGDFARYYHVGPKVLLLGREDAMATKVTQKGQVTIPKPIRDHLGIGPGSEVEFKRAADGSVVIAPADDKKSPSRFAKFVGILEPGPSTDEIMEWTRGD
jgi:AbrB family looped-hinge helix DNA binding protein